MRVLRNNYPRAGELPVTCSYCTSSLMVLPADYISIADPASAAPEAGEELARNAGSSCGIVCPCCGKTVALPLLG